MKAMRYIQTLLLITFFLVVKGAFAQVCLVTNTNDSGAGSLRAAIECANNRVGLDSIRFEFTEPNPVINADGQYVINLTESIKIEDEVVIDASSLGKSTSGLPKLRIQNSIGDIGTFVQNTEYIFQAFNSSTYYNINFYCDTLINNGGGIYVNQSNQEIVLKDCFFQSNYTSIHCRGKSVNADNCQFLNSNDTGILMLFGSISMANNCLFEGCGTAMNVSGTGTISIKKTSFIDNRFGLTDLRSSVSNMDDSYIDSCTFKENTLALVVRKLRGSNCVFEENVNGIRVSSSGLIELENSEFINNRVTSVEMVNAIGSSLVGNTFSYLSEDPAIRIYSISSTSHSNTLSRNVFNTTTAGGKAISLEDGANNGISAPSITYVSQTPDSVSVEITSSIGYKIEFFESNGIENNANKYLEGKDIMMEASSQLVTIPRSSLSLSHLIVTATNGNGSTSELSAVLSIPSVEANVCLVTNTNDAGEGSLRAAIECANNNPGVDIIGFAFSETDVEINTEGQYVIKVFSQINFTDGVIIDATNLTNTVAIQGLPKLQIYDSTNTSILFRWTAVSESSLKGIHFYHQPIDNFNNAVASDFNKNILIEIEECRFDNFRFGISGDRANTYKITNTDFVAGDFINSLSTYSCGVCGYDTDLYIENCLFDNTGTGIRPRQHSNLEVRKSSFLNNDYGVEFRESDTLIVTDSCVFSNNGIGVHLRGVYSPSLIENNYFNYSGTQKGIIISLFGNKNTFSQNVFVGLDETNKAITIGTNNGNKKKPEISSTEQLTNGNVLIKGKTQTVGDKIELFSHNGISDNANKYLTSFITIDTIWSIEVLNEGFSFFSATSTDSDGNTSEVATYKENILSCTVVTNTNDTGEGSLRAAIECANNNPGLDRISFDLDNSNNHTITVTTGNYQLSDSVIFDGGVYVNGKPWVTINDDRVDKSETLFLNTERLTVRRIEFLKMELINSGDLIHTASLIDSCQFSGISGRLITENCNLFSNSQVTQSNLISLGNFDAIRASKFFNLTHEQSASSWEVENCEFKDISYTETDNTRKYFFMPRVQYRSMDFTNNLIVGVDYFVSKGYATSLLFQKNRVSSSENTRTKIVVYNGYTSNEELIDNVFEDLDTALFLSYTSGYKIANNKFLNVKKGILKLDNNTAHGLVVSNNYFSNDSCGVCLNANNLSDNVFSNNSFVSNDIAIQLGASSNLVTPNNIRFYNNIFGLDSNNNVSPNLTHDINIVKCENCIIGDLDSINYFYSPPSNSIILKEGNGVRVKGIYVSGGQNKPFAILNNANGGIQAPEIITIDFNTSGEVVLQIVKSQGDTIDIYQSGDDNLINPQVHVGQFVSSLDTVEITILRDALDLSLPLAFSATITNTSSSTSEFSEVVYIESHKGVCLVTNINDAGEGSLRAAIECANFNLGMDTISFDFSSIVPNSNTKYLIQLESSLPSIFESVILDGDPYLNLNGEPLIEIDGDEFKILEFYSAPSSEISNILLKNGSQNLLLESCDSSRISNLWTYITNDPAETGRGINGQVDIINSESVIFVGSRVYTDGNNILTAGRLSVENSPNFHFGQLGDEKRNLVGGGFQFTLGCEGSKVVNTYFGLKENGVELLYDSLYYLKSKDGSGGAVPSISLNGQVTGVTIGGSDLERNVIAPYFNFSINGNSDSNFVFGNFIGLTSEGNAFPEVDYKKTVSGGGYISVETGASDNTIGSVATPNKFGLGKTSSAILMGYGGKRNTFSNNLISYYYGDYASVKPINICGFGCSNDNIPTASNLTQFMDTLKGDFLNHSYPLAIVEVFASNKLGKNTIQLLAHHEVGGGNEWAVPLDYEGYIVVTMTDSVGNTSQLSEPFYFKKKPENGVCLVTKTIDSGDSTLRQAITDANAGLCDKIHFAIPEVGPYVIEPQSQLPLVDAPSWVTIDGLTQKTSGVGSGNQQIVLKDNKNISFLGLGRAISGEDFTARGITFEAFTQTIYPASNVEIDSCRFNNSSLAIALSAENPTGSNVKILNTTFANCETAVGEYTQGTLVNLERYLSLTNCRIFNDSTTSYTGVSLRFGMAHVKVENCSFAINEQEEISPMNLYPLELRKVDSVSVSNSNFLTSNMASIAHVDFKYSKIHHNSFGISKNESLTGQLGREAIILQNGTNSHIEVFDNVIVNTEMSGIHVINAQSKDTASFISSNYIGVDEFDNNYTIKGSGIQFDGARTKISVLNNKIFNSQKSGISITNGFQDTISCICFNEIRSSVNAGIEIGEANVIHRIAGNILDSCGTGPFQNNGISLRNIKTIDSINNNKITNSLGNGVNFVGNSNTVIESFSRNDISHNGQWGAKFNYQLRYTITNFTGNKIHANGQGGIDFTSGVYANVSNNYIYMNEGDGVKYSNSTIDTLFNNYVFANKGKGLDIGYQGIINQLSANKIGYDTLGLKAANSGVGIVFNSADLNGSVLLDNDFYSSDTSSVVVVNDQNITLTQNIFETEIDNLAIDLVNSGNNQKPSPTILDYRYAFTDTLFISGKSKPNDLVEVFLNDGNPQNAILYLATAITTTDSTWQAAIVGENGFSSADTVRVIATATDTLGNTSELSTIYVVPEKSVETNCIVTTLNDFEAGSLREAITCANRSAAASTVTISFDIDTAVALVLPITTPLPPLSRYGYRALLTGPNADNRPVSLVGDTTLTGISGNRFEVTELHFSNFKSALSLGNNTTVENVSFDNNQVAVLVEGDANLVQNNRFLNQDKAAIRVSSGNNNQLLSNYISKEEIATAPYKAIELVGASNNSQGAPTNMTYEEVAGTILKGEGVAGDKIQVFLSTQQVGEVYEVVAETNVATDGTWEVELPSQFLQEGINDFFVATATSSTGSTSELSEVIRVGNDPVRCYVTNELDTGEGSLRAAVACVTEADAYGLSGDIIFDPDSAETYAITLTSPIVGQNRFGINLSKDSTESVVLEGVSSAGLVLSGNNLHISDLSFVGFDTALVLTGNNNKAENLTITSGNIGLTLTGLNGSISNSVFGDVSIGVALVNASGQITNNFFGANRDSSANAIQGYGISLWQSPNVGIQKNNFGTIEVNPSLTLPENGSAIYAVNGSSKLEIRDNDFTLNSDTTESAIAGNAVFISGDNPQTPSASNFTSNEATIVENDIISSSVAFNLHQVSSSLIEGNRVQSTQADAIVIDAGKGNKILNTQIYRTPAAFKGISLVNLGNDTLPAPTLDFIDFFDAKGGLFVNGLAPANASIEFFEASSTAQTAVRLLKRTQANAAGEWSVTINKDNLNLNGTNYFTATARDATGNTSELATDLSITINACMVTKTANAGDSTLRDAITRANNSECNLLLFDISPLDTTQNYITIETELPALTKSNVIVDASSEVGFRLQRGGGVVTVVAEDSSLNGFRVSGTHGVPVHGLNVANLVSGVVIENTTKTTWDYGQFSNNGTAVNVVGGSNALLQLNRVVGNETGEAINGFIVSGQDHEINENYFSDLTQLAIRLTGSGHKADTNAAYNIGQNTVFEVGKAAYVLESCSDVMFTNNSADTASVGFYFSASDSLTLVDLNANASTNYGFYFDNCDEVTITRSQVDSCGNGGLYATGGQNNSFAIGVSKAAGTAVMLENESSPTVQQSFLTECGQGIKLVNSKSATIDENYLIDLTGDVVLIDKTSGNATITNNQLGLEGIGNTGVALTLLSDSNTIENNKVYDNLGGGIVTTGQHNRIVKNLIGKNDTARYRPSTKGIDLSDGVGNVGISEPTILGKFTSGSDSTATITVSGEGVEGDTIHLYLNGGWYESALKYIDKTVVDVDGKWLIVLNKSALLFNVTSYGIATATNKDNKTSELSNIFPLGDCYVVSNEDNGDNDYPPTGSYRKAIGCLNVQQESTNLLFEISGEATIQLEAPIDSIYNRFGFNYYGANGGSAPATLTKIDSLYTSTIPALRVNIDSGLAYVSQVKIESFETAVDLVGDGITLDGLTLIGDTLRDGNTGITFMGDSIRLNNLTVRDFELGVDANNSMNLRVSGGNYSSLDRAIDASNSTGLVVANARFGSSINGSVYGDGLQKATLRDNQFGALGNVNFASLWLENATAIAVEGNRFSKTQRDTQSRFADEYTAHDIYISSGVDSLSIINNQFLGGEGRAISFSPAQASNQYTHIDIKKNTADNYDGDVFFIAAEQVVIDNNDIVSVRRVPRDTSLYIPEHNWFIDTVLYVVTGSNHAITVYNTNDVTLTNNRFDGGAESVVDIRESENVLVSRSTIIGFDDTVLPIDIHKGSGELSNNDKVTPEILRYEFILDSCAKYLYLVGTSEPFDEIELFFSDSANYLNAYADSTIADEEGFWAYRVPPELYPKPQEEGLYYIATGSDTVHGTSQASNMLYIPPFVDSLLVKNTADTGAFSLREAIKAVNCSKFYSVVTFDFGSDFSLQTIALQTPLDTINSFLGFEMNGWGKDQYQVLIDGSVLVDTTGFGFYIDTASTEAIISHLAFKDFDTAIVVGNSKMQLSNLDISSTREGALGLHLLSNNTATTFEKSFIHDLSKGIRVDSANSKLVIKENLFQQVDSSIHIGQSVNESEIINNIIGGFNGYAIWLDSAGGKGNLIQSNYIGYDVNKAPNVSSGVGIIMTHTNNQTVEENTIGNISGVGVVLEGFSEGNSIKTNRIGLVDSLTASPIDGEGIVIRTHAEAGGRPTTNFVSENTIIHVSGTGLWIEEADANNISTNAIGLNTNGEVTAIGDYAILDRSTNANNYFNNTLVGYVVNGINVENSSQALISQNTIYSPNSTGDGINLNRNGLASNTPVQVPAITQVELIDTSKVMVSGTAPQANTRIELFKGYEGNKQAIDYVATAIPVNGVWTLEVSRSFFKLSEKVFFTATATDNNGNTSEFSEVSFIDEMLCKIPEDIDLLVDSKLVCPGIEVKLNAGLEGFNYEWTSDSLENPETTQYLTVTKEAVYFLRMYDDNGCEYTDQFDLQLREKATKPDYLVASEVFLGDTIVLVDLQQTVNGETAWAFDGANAWKETEDADYWNITFPEVKDYTIAQINSKESCTTIQQHDIKVLDPFFYTDSTSIFFHTLSIDEFTVNPSPNDRNQPFTVRIKLSKPADMTLMFFSEQGIRSLNTIELKGADTYEVNLPVTDLVSGTYIIRVFSYSISESKVVIISE